MPNIGRPRDLTGFKITYGWDNEYVVGEIFLKPEIIQAMESGQEYDLSMVFVQTDGLELVGLSLIPKQVVELPKPVKEETKKCKFCNNPTSLEWWKCCPEHFPGPPNNEFSCKACVNRNHPGFFSTGGE